MTAPSAAGRADDHLPDAVVHLDATLSIVAVNAALEALVGRPAGELVGAPFAATLDARTGDGRHAFVDGLHPSAALPAVRGIPEIDLSVRHRDGQRLGLRATGRYLRGEDGDVTGVVISMRRARRRDDRTPSGIEIVSTVSHELRAPLTSVKGYTSLLLKRWDRLPDTEKVFMLEQVQHDADRVTRLITELLDISRLETGRLVLRRQMVDLPEVTRTVVAKVAMEHEGFDCEPVFPPDFPRVYADPDKVVQVLTNLLENACKYASPHGVRVAGSVDEEQGAVTLSVADRGEGIPPEELPMVFQKFFRRSEGRPTGSGLGLWISRGLVEAHGGRLTASSEVGEGTTFQFTLPLDAFEEATPL